jgi:hypothetical protein
MLSPYLPIQEASLPTHDFPLFNLQPSTSLQNSAVAHAGTLVTTYTAMTLITTALTFIRFIIIINFNQSSFKCSYQIRVIRSKTPEADRVLLFLLLIIIATQPSIYSFLLMNLNTFYIFIKKISRGPSFVTLL